MLNLEASKKDLEKKWQARSSGLSGESYHNSPESLNLEELT